MINKLKLALITAGYCLLIVSCKQAQVQQAVAEYEVKKIVLTDETRTDRYSASIRGKQDVDIYPQVSGAIINLAVEEGRVVTRGQTLFVIDQVPYQAALQTATANIQVASASMSSAQLAFDSKKELFANDIISEFDLRTTENQLLSAQAILAQAKAQELIARNNLSYTVVKSPVNGVVGTLPFRVGALVGPTIPRPLTTVSDNSQMYVYFSMTEKQLLALNREYGSKEEILKALPKIKLELSDGINYPEEGYVETISGVIDPLTGAVSVRAVFPNAERLLNSGSSGSIVVPYVTEGAVVIPQNATFELQDKIFVYKIVDGKTFSTMITVEPSDDGQRYVVTSGLAEGDTILTEGVALMREGTAITPKQPQTPTTPSNNEGGEPTENDAKQAGK